MRSTLVFPDGVRLARPDELPESTRDEGREKLAAAAIHQGVVLKRADEAGFTWYAEINVDAPRLWVLFRALCEALIGEFPRLVAGANDGDVVTVGQAGRDGLLEILELFAYQLANDGFLQFGLISDHDGRINEVFVAPSKHLKVWLNDRERFIAVIDAHGLALVDHLSFIDEFPRVTTQLEGDDVHFEDAEHLIDVIGREIAPADDGPLN